MNRKQSLRLAAGTLLALTLTGTLACAPRAGLSPVTPSAPGVTASGGLALPVTLPALGDRGVQYAYNNGYINALEVVLVDSLGRHQAYVVCRNPDRGAPGGSVNVLFQDVAPGTAWITVRTTYRQLIGEKERLAPVAGKPSTFKLDGGPTQVTAVSGDITTNVMVFKSTDLGGTASAPSVLSFYQNNDGGSELNDASAIHAGYGVGAATGSVVAGNTATLSVQVSQPPTFGTTMLNGTRHTDAGTEITFPASNIQPGDRVVVVRASNPSATSDFIDLTKVANYDFYPLAEKATGSYAFTPTRSTGGMVNYYLSRGEMVSKIGADNGGVSLAKVHVHPEAVSAANSTVRIGSDDGTARMPRRASETDTLYLTLRDQYNNLITGADFGTRSMENFVWRPVVEPSSTLLNNDPNGTSNAPNPLAFVPGSTIGRLTTPTDANNDGVWESTFTQGAVAPTTRGASASFSLANNTRIRAVSYLHDTSNLAATTAYALGVTTDPTTVSNPTPALWLSLYRGASVAAGTFIASRSYQPNPAAPDGDATISVTPTAPDGLPLVLRVGRNLGSDLSTADNDTRITVTVGARAEFDIDVTKFRIYRQNTDGSLTLRSAITGGSYSWKQ